MKSVMTNRFSMIPSATIPRSNFSRSHGNKTAFNAGQLIPFYIDEVLPGDTFNVKLSHLARVQTLLVPLMDNLFFDFFYFFVPNRLVWTNWQKLMGERTNPTDVFTTLTPLVNFSVTNQNTLSNTLADYLALPIESSAATGTLSVTALPFRAYWLIWNEWFRDQNLQPSFAVPTGDGPDAGTTYISSTNPGLAPRCKRHDYFTSCLPLPQKGPGVSIPLGTTAVVKSVETFPYAAANQPIVRLSSDGTTPSATDAPLYADISKFRVGFAPSTLNAFYDPKGSLYADLSTATAVTINSLRQAFQIQRLYERDARGGTRYTEILRAHFGVVSPDARLQRPEYLGGSSVPLLINPVAQTSASGLTGGNTPQGKLAAFGLSSAHGHGFVKSFVEHGIILGLCCVRGDITYQQGLNRMWTRRQRFDYYWPALSHLGEQAVLRGEIYWSGAAAQDDLVFGYQERWAEYRYKPSTVTGLFRSGVPNNLSYWHLAEYFDGTGNPFPSLNAAFITDKTKLNLDRCLAVPSTTAGSMQFIFDSYLDIKTARPMPAYSVPGLIDHF